MAKSIRYALVLLYATFLVAAPYWYYRTTREHFRNFREVTPQVLYRSGQLNEKGLAKLVHEHGFKTIVTLRSNDGPEDHNAKWEEEFCAKKSIEFVRLPAKPYWSKDGSTPARSVIRKFFDVVRDPEKYPRPILLHCFAGEHRTGALVALYRIEFENWTNEEALEEMRQLGYVRIWQEWDVRSFIQHYEPTSAHDNTSGAATTSRRSLAKPLH